jgi:hypothetical protein
MARHRPCVQLGWVLDLATPPQDWMACGVGAMEDWMTLGAPDAYLGWLELLQ